MLFRTEIFPEKPEFNIEHHEKIFTIGSCFAQNIANKFEHFKFNIVSNPFGVLFNPISILNSIKILADNKLFSEEDLFFDQSEYHSFYHHSDFSHHDKKQCLDNINHSISINSNFLKNADLITITFGTSFIYRHNEKNIIVSNCHKIPQSEFTSKRLSLVEIINTIKEIKSTIRKSNENAKIIFTVSPIRHWKDGAIENQLSKASLLLAINNQINGNEVYFPSYEILMDDLRDYRFYEEDLLHPNKIAIDYIWEKFSSTFFTKECFKIMDEINKITQAYNHRPRNTNSTAHQQFLLKTIFNIEKIKNLYPYIDFTKEVEYFYSLTK